MRASIARLCRQHTTAQFLALLACCLVRPAHAAEGGAPPAAAESPVYNIELVVFRSGGGAPGEDFSAQPPLRGGPGSDADAGSSTHVGRFVQAIPSSRFQLGELESRLRAGGYTPLAHVAWSQTASPFGAHAGFTLQRLGAEAAGLSGIVFLERGQFLHLGMSLAYSPATPGPVYRMSEIRRIRFYEKNYFDHPGFGAIALVTPAQGARAPGR
jgi:hypothetical protein